MCWFWAEGAFEVRVRVYVSHDLFEDDLFEGLYGLLAIMFRALKR